MKFKIISFVFLFLMVNVAQAQVKFRVKKLNADSLAALLHEKEGTEKIDIMNLFSNVICRKNIDSSINLASRAIDLSEKLNYKKGLADGYFNVGNGYFLLDSLKPTITNYLKALRIYEDIEPTVEYGNLCIQLALMNYFTGRLEENPQYTNVAKSIFDQIGDNVDKYNIYFSLGVGKSVQQHPEPDSAIYYCNKAMLYIDTATQQNELAYIYSDIGEVYSPLYTRPGDTSDLTTALSWFFKGLKLPLIPDDTKTTLYLNIASTYLGYNTDKHTSAAISYLQKAKNMPDTCMGVYDQKSAVFQMLGAISYSQGDYQKAISLYKKGVKMAEDRLPKLTINEYPEPVHAYNNRYYLKIDKQLMYEGLYDSYSKLGEFEKAIEYYILSKQAAEEIYLEQNQNLVIMLESISEDEKTKSRIALLARDNKLKELTIKQSRTLNFGIAGVFIVLILIGLLFLRQNKLKNEHKTVVLEQKLFRLQMNPHFIFNVHSNILGFIENKNTDSAAKYLSTFSKLLRTTLESSRNDHIYLDEEINMIKDYLDLQILLYENKFEYTLEVDDKLDIDDVTIPPMLIQPFIENAIKHGISHKKGKGHVFVRFKLENKIVICEVEDDGVGREKAWEAEYKTRKEHKSLATSIIHDRIQAINKKMKQKINLNIIDLKSDNNESVGTRVVLDLPLS